MAVCWELARPGRIVPGVVGLGLATVGGDVLWRSGPRAASVALLAIASLILICEVFWNSHRFGPIAASLLLAIGFGTLFPTPPRIHLYLVLPLAAIMGMLIGRLCGVAREARRAKRREAISERD